MFCCWLKLKYICTYTIVRRCIHTTPSPLPSSGQKLVRYFLDLYETVKQGCQKVYFQTKTPIFGIFWKALAFKILMTFMTIWCTFWSFSLIYGDFGIFCGKLAYFSHVGI
jgi:hypothetical protein